MTNFWLLIAYTQLDEYLQVIAGEVLAHSPDRDTLYAALPLGRRKDIAIECFAQVPEDLDPTPKIAINRLPRWKITR